MFARTARLEKLGIVWKPSNEKWMEGYRRAKSYLRLLNGKPWRTNYISPDGHRTGEWMDGQLRIFRKGRMKPERLSALQEIGLIR